MTRNVVSALAASATYFASVIVVLDALDRSLAEIAEAFDPTDARAASALAECVGLVVSSGVINLLNDASPAVDESISEAITGCIGESAFGGTTADLRIAGSAVAVGLRAMAELTPLELGGTALINSAAELRLDVAGPIRQAIGAAARGGERAATLTLPRP